MMDHGSDEVLIVYRILRLDLSFGERVIARVHINKWCAGIDLIKIYLLIGIVLCMEY